MGQLTVDNTPLEFSLDAGGAQPIHVADGGELPVKQGLALYELDQGLDIRPRY